MDWKTHGTIHVARLAAIASLAIGIAGCAAADNSSQIESKLGCHFDARKVCESALTQPMQFSSGLTTSNQTYFQQNSPPTAWVQAPLVTPGGTHVDVQCEISTQKHTVIYANAVPTQSLSDSDRKWLHDTGYCIDSSGGERAPAVRPES